MFDLCQGALASFISPLASFISPPYKICHTEQGVGKVLDGHETSMSARPCCATSINWSPYKPSHKGQSAECPSILTAVHDPHPRAPQ